jgi:gliding motility-associated-like protein
MQFKMMNNTSAKGIFFLLLSTSFGISQMRVSEDVYVAKEATLYIGVENTLFDQGKISTDRTPDHYGLVAFAEAAKWTQADHNAHVDGYVRMYSDKDFSFPVGHNAVFQPLHLTRTEEHTPVDLAYNHVAHTNLTAEIGIAKVSDEFYWNFAGEHPAYVRLSWNAFSNVDRLTGNSLQALGIAGYDGSTWRWIEAEVETHDFVDNSPSTLLAGSIVSKNPVFLEGYEAFTLVSLEEVIPVKVSQGFTPNGDGINDIWFIGDIDKFPKAMIKVFSRWGREVFFSPGNYQNNWNGIYKTKNEPLPDASYFYVIDLENDGEMDLLR